MYLSKENGDFVKDVLNIFTSPKLKWEKTTLIFSYSIDGHVMIWVAFLKAVFVLMETDFLSVSLHID